MQVKHAKNESKCWRYKNYIVLSFVTVKIMFIICWNPVPFLTRKKNFYPRTFFLSFYPTLLLFYFIQEYIKIQGNQPTLNKLRRLLLKKLDYSNFSFRYVYTSYHSSFSILSGYGILFVQLSQKSDSKQSLRILRTSEYSATSINCSLVI